MAGRVREYAGMAREHLAERHGAAPAPLPIVLYNGSDRWTAPGAVAELPGWSLAARSELAPFQGWDYVLLSLEWLLSSGGLVRLPLGNRAAATLRLQAERMPAKLVARLREEWARFAGETDAATRRILHVWTGALLADMGGAESALPALPELEERKGGTDMATVSQALFAEWLEEVRVEHVEQERTRGFARLRRQVAIKFGVRTAERLSALLGTVTVKQMEHLADRVSDWIVECEDSEDLLARVSAAVGNGGANS